MTTPSFDVVVVGGGIVGLATALALKTGAPASLAVLEADAHLERRTGAASPS